VYLFSHAGDLYLDLVGVYLFLHVGDLYSGLIGVSCVFV